MWCDGLAFAQTVIPDRLEWFTALKDVQLRTQSEITSGIFIAEGEVVIRRAAAAGYQLLAVMAQARWVEPLGDLIEDSVDVIIDDAEVLSGLTGYHIHRGALAAFGRLALPNADEVLRQSQRTVFIEGMVNHTNVGAIFRSAAAMRMDAILVDQHCADPLYRRAIRTSMGTVFQLPWTRADLGDLSADSGLIKVALTPNPDARDIRTVDWEQIQRLALVVGTEGEGLTLRAQQVADFAVTIPMSSGVDSLNAAAATAIACHEIMRGR